MDKARRRAGLTVQSLWSHYFELGGSASPTEVDAFLAGALVPPRIERDTLAHAINEAFMDIESDERVDYLFNYDADSRSD